MEKQLNAQKIAAEFAWNVLRKTKGIYAKRENLLNSKNLKTRYSKYWKIFEECDRILLQYPEIDYRKYIEFAVNVDSSEYILPTILTSLKTFRLYSEMGGKSEPVHHSDQIIAGIQKSIATISSIMLNENLKNINSFTHKYLNFVASAGAPLIFELYMKGLITSECIQLLPKYQSYISKYPSDIRIEMKLDSRSIVSRNRKLSSIEYNNKKLIDLDIVSSIEHQIGV